MYRIRFHGRGGQEMKTASRMLGTAFFLTGYQVQDAPRYGAERRGAPIFAYVRAAHNAIHERGVIRKPDLVIVADDSLVPEPSAGVLQGANLHTVMLINSSEEAAVWKHRLNFAGTVITLPTATLDRTAQRFIGATCVGAAARLLGVISRETLQTAIGEELTELSRDIVQRNLQQALTAFDSMETRAGCVGQSTAVSAETLNVPDWIELPADESDAAAAAIHASATSVEVRTGLWRTIRPVIDYARCNHCWWVCSEFCPDSAIKVIGGRPEIDYDHCKGCMICVAQCPPHAIATVPEHSFIENAQ